MIVNFYRYVTKLLVNIIRPFIQKSMELPFQSKEVLFLDTKFINPSHNKIHNPVVWFHAASAGELESLAPVIEGLIRETQVNLVISTFSPSGVSNLKKMADFAESLGARHRLELLMSPWEGEWGFALKKRNPKVFITAKYESWPELWISLKEYNIPLMIIGAQLRSSLLIAKRICNLLTGGLPDICFFGENAAIELIKNNFKQNRYQIAADSRWDRGSARMKNPTKRANELINIIENKHAPFIVLGSLWSEDLKILGKSLFDENKETLTVIVPHDVDEVSVARIQDELVKLGLNSFTTCNRTSSEINEFLELNSILLVNEVGVLLNLYKNAKWVYVGGGFSKGVHSTIEPALWGVPVFCGPKNAEMFPEIKFLEGIGQLNQVTDPNTFQKMKAKLSSNTSELLTMVWHEKHKEKLGSTRIILDQIKIKLGADYGK